MCAGARQATKSLAVSVMWPICLPINGLLDVTVLQLRVNKRQISVHVGQRSGGGGVQRVTSLIHMFPVDPLKSLFDNSLLHLDPQISSQLQFVIVEVTGARSQRCWGQGNGGV